MNPGRFCKWVIGRPLKDNQCYWLSSELVYPHLPTISLWVSSVQTDGLPCFSLFKMHTCDCSCCYSFTIPHRLSMSSFFWKSPCNLSGPLCQLFRPCFCTGYTWGLISPFLDRHVHPYLSIYRQYINGLYDIKIGGIAFYGLTKTWHPPSFSIESPVYLCWIAVLKHASLING